MNWKMTDPFLIYLFCQNVWRNLFFNNLPGMCQHSKSAQPPSVCLPVRAQHGDCSSPHTHDLLTSLDDKKNFSSLAFVSHCSLWYNRPWNSSLSPQTWLWHSWYSPELFRSYLSDRKQYFLIYDQNSTQTSLDFGVPQVSVLGCSFSVQHYLHPPSENAILSRNIRRRHATQSF